VTRTTSALLLGTSVALSALTLFSCTPGGVICIGWQCLTKPDPEQTICCTSGTLFYSCDVSLDNNPPAVLTAAMVTVTGCYATLADAMEEASGLAEAMYGPEYPATHASLGACHTAVCPGAGAS
jgi:hypothetical protein